MATKTVILRSSDNQKFTVDLEVAKLLTDPLIQEGIKGKRNLTGLLASGLDYCSSREEIKRGVIPLNFVTGDILEKVLEWAKHEVEKNKSGDEERAYLFTGMTDWEEDYLKDNLKVMCDLSKAAANLGARGLVDLYFRFVANWLLGRIYVNVPDILMFQLGRALKANWRAERPQRHRRRRY